MIGTTTLLRPLRTNEYTIKDSLAFAEELQSFNSKLLMASVDIESLFANFPLQKTKQLLKNYSDQEFYKQHDRVAIGSPLGPTLPNLFLCYNEKTWFQNCLSEFKRVIYRRSVDDTFLFFHFKYHPE